MKFVAYYLRNLTSAKRRSSRGLSVSLISRSFAADGRASSGGRAARAARGRAAGRRRRRRCGRRLRTGHRR